MDEELLHIANDIYADAIAQLTLHLRFMDIALNRFIFVPDTADIRCDGRYFHYSPVAVIHAFRNDPHTIPRGYLHVILHSVFEHIWFAKQRRMSLWDLACDIAVEQVILGLDLDLLSLPRDDERKRIIASLQEQLDDFTAQRLYHLLEDTDPDRVRLMSELFRYDHHESWYELRDVTGSAETLYGEETGEDTDGAGNNRFDNASHDTGERSESDGTDEDAVTEQVRSTEEDWRKISERLEAELERYREVHGIHTEPLIQSLKKLHREKADYAKFLHRFTETGEKMQISDEDFDPIFYTYGLDVYGNLPLIEPLESRETRSVRELVIAIDTSGSVQGDTVQAFLQKTYDLFRQRDSFFSRFNIHILQCDMEIRDIAVITSYRQFETYIRTVEIKGLSGTDFRPVFTYIEEQIRKGAFRRFGGLLYFTDGDGVYPSSPPPWKTAFLFPENTRRITVPPWAVRYTLEGDEFDAYTARKRTD